MKAIILCITAIIVSPLCHSAPSPEIASAFSCYWLQTNATIAKQEIKTAGISSALRSLKSLYERMPAYTQAFTPEHRALLESTHATVVDFVAKENPKQQLCSKATKSIPPEKLSTFKTAASCLQLYVSYSTTYDEQMRMRDRKAGIAAINSNIINQMSPTTPLGNAIASSGVSPGALARGLVSINQDIARAKNDADAKQISTNALKACLAP